MQLAILGVIVADGIVVPNPAEILEVFIGVVASCPDQVEINPL
jgi:hypothetical protein